MAIMKHVAHSRPRPSEAGDSVEGGSVALRIKGAGQELCDALHDLVQQVPAKSGSAEEFARTLKVHRTLAGRVLRAMRTDDALAALTQLPRGEGLRMVLQAARASVTREAVDRAEAALHGLEEIVHRELGGWDGFDAAISEWLPEARARFALANKQLVFKGMANLIGARADVQLETAIYYPDADGRRCDIAIIEGFVNLRRLRPGVRVPVVAHAPNPQAPRPLGYTLEDVPPGEAQKHYPLLEQFCSRPRPQLEAIPTGEMTSYVLGGDAIGASSAVDIFAASIVRGGRPMYRGPSDPPVRPHVSGGVNLPTKTLLMNILLHEDIWPGDDPQLVAYDMRARGMASPDDPGRELDRIESVETVQPLGKGVGRFRASEVGCHVEIVEHVCERLGWDSARLRGYRVRVQYPLLNAQHCIVFSPLPVRDADAAH